MKTIISGILIVSGLCLAGASSPDFKHQIVFNGAGTIMLGAGLLILKNYYAKE